MERHSFIDALGSHVTQVEHHGDLYLETLIHTTLIHTFFIQFGSSVIFAKIPSSESLLPTLPCLTL